MCRQQSTLGCYRNISLYKSDNFSFVCTLVCSNSGFIRFNGQNNSTKTHCYLWSNFHLTLKNIFDKQPDVKKYFDKRTARHKICSKLESKFTTGTRHVYTNSNSPWWCSWVSTRVFGKSNRDLEYVIILNFCDVKIRHKSDHPYKQTNMHKIEFSFGYT
jgi:hypothetical protein